MKARNAPRCKFRECEFVADDADAVQVLHHEFGLGRAARLLHPPGYHQSPIEELQVLVNHEVGPLVPLQVQARVHLQDEQVQREDVLPNVLHTPKTQNAEEYVQLPTVALRGRLGPRDEVRKALAELLSPGLTDTDR